MLVLGAVVRPVLVRIIRNCAAGLAVVGATVDVKPVSRMRASRARRGARRAAARLGARAAAGA